MPGTASYHIYINKCSNPPFSTFPCTTIYLYSLQGMGKLEKILIDMLLGEEHENGCNTCLLFVHGRTVQDL